MTNHVPMVSFATAPPTKADYLPNDSALCDATIADINAALPLKFYRGSVEHGGVLTHKDCLGNAIEEIWDLAVYLRGVKSQHDAIRSVIADCKSEKLTAEQALNIIEHILIEK